MNSKAIIHLSKLDHNLEVIDQQLKPGVKKMAVIKDNAYGHGLLELAKHISDKVEWFCVARVDEGVRLRANGIGNPILVFEAPRSATAALYTEHQLTATLSEVSLLEVMVPGTEYHINIDTGMHRIGVLPEDISELREQMEKHPELSCTGIYTHFFKSDDPGNPEVAQQLELFKSVRKDFPAELMTHTANTGAIFHYQALNLQFDAVRPGVCLYGYGAGDVEIPELEPIVDWTSFLMQVKKVKKGEPVSYGGRWTAPEDGFIGVVPAGYSDGIFRTLSGKIKVQIDGKLYPQVGTISMDYLVVYLGEDKPEKGAEVFLLRGKELNASEWASQAGTIPYEITTSIRDKVIREYRPD